MSKQNDDLLSIDITPSVSVYATYRRLSYKPWYAVAEFVDNTTQNYYDNRDKLLEAYKREGEDSKLKVVIDYDSHNNTLTILDNANGMNIKELTRAIVLDSPPPITDGRCEYGMGLKTAACWFGSTWQIETTRLGSTKEYTAVVHVPDLIEKKSDEILVAESKASSKDHYTRITISGLFKPIRGRTPSRVREQLSSMYRNDIRSGEIQIFWNGDELTFAEAPIFEEDLGNGIINYWKKDVSFEVPWISEGTSLFVKGWIGVRIPGKQRDAGFVLMRRGRVIVGGPGEGYKPPEVFGQGNTFRSQRLIGELHMDQWPVTQAKDAFAWSGGLEDAFIELLRKHCHDYMDKSEGIRQSQDGISKSDMILATEKTIEVFRSKEFSDALAQELELPEPTKSGEEEVADLIQLETVSEGPIVYQLNVGTSEWTFRLHWQDKITDAHWMSVSYPTDEIIDIFLNLSHPFFVQYMDQPSYLELLQKFVVSLALAERLARNISPNGLIAPGDFRNYMNRVLRYASEMEIGNGS